MVKAENQIIYSKSMVELIDMKTNKTTNESVAMLAKERYFGNTIQMEAETVVITEHRRFVKEGFVTCVLCSDGTKFEKQHEDIQAYGESILEENEPIWYRAIYVQKLVKLTRAKTISIKPMWGSTLSMLLILNEAFETNKKKLNQFPTTKWFYQF